MKNWATVSAALFVAALTAGPASAGSVYSNGPSSRSGGYIFSDAYRVADDFTLGLSTRLGGITFSQLRVARTTVSSYTWAVYGDNGSSVGPTLAGGTATAFTAADTGFVLSGQYRQSTVSFSLPDVALPAGTYWFGIHANVAVDANGDAGVAYWDWSGGNGSTSARQSFGGGPYSIVTGGQVSFELDGVTSAIAAAPLPAAAWGGTSLLGLVGARSLLARRRTSAAT